MRKHNSLATMVHDESLESNFEGEMMCYLSVQFCHINSGSIKKSDIPITTYHASNCEKDYEKFCILNITKEENTVKKTFQLPRRNRLLKCISQ